MAFPGPSWPTEMCFIFSYQWFSHVDLRMDASVSANCCLNGNFVNVINLPCRHVLRTYFAVCSVCLWIIRSSLLFFGRRVSGWGITGRINAKAATMPRTLWRFGSKWEAYTTQFPSLLPVACLLNIAKEQNAGFRLCCSEFPSFCQESGLNLLVG